MARVSKTIDHDYLTFRANFTDGTKTYVTFSRGGENATVRPHDPERAERLSNIAMQVVKRLRQKDATYPYKNLNDVLDAMEKIAKPAATLDQYLDGLVETLGVSGERPKPKAAGNAPAEASVGMKQSRGGWLIEARYPNGERFELKINRSSISWVADPAIASRDNEVSRLVFEQKLNGGLADEELATLVKEKAADASDIDGWLADLRDSFSPSPRR